MKTPALVASLRRTPLLLALGAGLCAAWCRAGSAGASEPPPAPASSRSAIRAIHYEGRLGDPQARFVATLELDVESRREIVLPLFEGDVALLPARLPAGLRLGRAGGRYCLWVSRAGRCTVRLELLARVQRSELWNEVGFRGPTAGIVSLAAEAGDPGAEVQMLTGIPEAERTGEPAEEARHRVRGFLGAEQRIALRWRSRAAETPRQPLVAGETTTVLRLSPGVIQCETDLRFEVLQGAPTSFAIAWPPEQTLTRVEGDRVRDWQWVTLEGRPALKVDLIGPAGTACGLRILSEQLVDSPAWAGRVELPRPLFVERESVSVQVRAADLAVEVLPPDDWRQVDPPSGCLAAYRSYGQSASLGLRLNRLEPRIRVAERVAARLEEAALRLDHHLELQVEQSGLHTLELAPLHGAMVTDVQAEGLADWSARDDRLRLSFQNGLLGARSLVIRTELPHRDLPERITIRPLRAAGATRQTAQIGAASAPGIRLKTSALDGVREVPVARLDRRTDELLAFLAEDPDWAVTLATEKPAPRTIAEVFNLMTFGDGLMGGSATMRYVIINQGVREFRVQVPASWRNVEFTGPNLRRKVLQDGVWTVTLQDKVWGAYTLVVTYDVPFDPAGDALSVGGLRALDAERETGTVAITSAAGLELREVRAGGPLRRIDEAELAAPDRALITRSAWLAYRYGSGEPYDLVIAAARFPRTEPLAAFADRAHLTTVLAETGQMLTRATFLVKNNDRQFQRITLPSGAEWWSASVEGRPVKAEEENGDFLVPLPRGDNRDRAFPVEVVYAQSTGSLKSRLPRRLALAAPRTDVRTTYAEWEVRVPATHHLRHLGGTMTAGAGPSTPWSDAGRQLRDAYRDLLRDPRARLGGAALIVLLTGILLLSVRRGHIEGKALLAALVILVGLTALAVLPLGRAWSLRASGPRSGEPDGAAVQSANAQPGDPNPPLLQAVPTRPTAAGGLSIDLPRDGRRFVFAQVLNLGDAPIEIEAWAVTARMEGAARAALQATLILAGLALLGRERHRARPRSLAVTLALGLLLCGAVSVALSARLLGCALVLLGPALAWGGVGLTLRSLWLRRPGDGAEPVSKGSGPLPALPGGVSPLSPLIALLLTIGVAEANESGGPAQAEALDTHLAPGPASILTATYRGSVGDERARLEAELELSASQDGEIIHLLDEDVAIESFSARPARWELVRGASGFGVRAARPGVARVRLGFLVRVDGDAARRRLRFSVPAALSSRVELDLSEPDAEVEFPGAIALSRMPGDRGTRVEAVLGAVERLELAWAPRVKRSAEISATVVCRNATLVGFYGGGLTLRSVLDFQATQGELRELRVRLPEGHRLLRVEGEHLLTWKVRDTDRTLAIELSRDVAPAYRLVVETEAFADRLPATHTLELPQAVDVRRETGWVALGGSDDLALAVEAAEGLQPGDSTEFVKGFGPARITGGAFQFLKPGFTLRVRVETLKPRIEALVQNRVQVGADQVRLSAHVSYTIERAGVFNLSLALPADYRVESVTGEEVAQWTERPDSARRELEIALKRRTVGACAVRVDLVRSYAAMPGALDVPSVHPLGTARLTGFVLVAAEPGVQVKPATLEGLTEVPAASVETGARHVQAGTAGPEETPARLAPGQAYRFMVSEPVPDAPPWRLVVAPERVPSWVRAEIVNWFTLGETLAMGRARVRFDIQNAPTKEFRLRIPAAFRNVEIEGANLRRRDQDGEEWRVELQSKVLGSYALTITWDQPWSVVSGTREGLFPAVGIGALDVERETGALAVITRSSLQIEARSVGAGLLRIDPRELPDWAGPVDPQTVLAYRYLRPGYELALAAQRFSPATALQAIAEEVRLTTVVADHGQRMTAVTVQLRNQGRQFLELTLPPGAAVWSAFVAGQAVEPSLREGRVLLPLEGVGGGLTPVELVYVSAGEFPRSRGDVGLASPAFDVPIQSVRWELYLPAGYRYSGFGGTMTRVTDGGPAYQAYTLSDYQHVETLNRQVREAALTSSVSAVRSNLRQGRLDEASKAFALARRYGLADAKGEARELEGELKKAQGGNLLNAQQLAIANNPEFVQQAGPAVQTLAPGFDNDAAERQWDKLQQAQEVAAGAGRPLKVSLPLRGLRQAFTQTLQTRIGEPMEIRFTASSARTAGWVARAVAAALAFAGLWGGVTLVLRLLPARAVRGQAA